MGLGVPVLVVEWTRSDAPEEPVLEGSFPVVLRGPTGEQSVAAALEVPERRVEMSWQP